LIGGNLYEPHEENPMIGFRGASRYYDPRYRDAFALECLLIHVSPPVAHSLTMLHPREIWARQYDRVERALVRRRGVVLAVD
jgi:phosphoenolpyruvate synthase/pyruvate phosphate dikinase